MTVGDIRDIFLENMRAACALLGIPASVCDTIFAPLADDVALAYAQSVVHP